MLPIQYGFKSAECPGLINSQINQAMWPVNMGEMLSELNLCTFILQVCNQDKWKKLDVNKVVFDIVNSKSEVAKQNNFVQNIYNKLADNPPDKNKLVKALLITDLHLDWEYMAGVSNNCGRP